MEVGVRMLRCLTALVFDWFGFGTPPPPHMPLSFVMPHLLLSHQAPACHSLPGERPPDC